MAGAVLDASEIVAAEEGSNRAHLTTAVFVTADRALSAERWTWYLHGALSKLGEPAHPIELVTMSSGPRGTTFLPAAIRMPINVACPGDIEAQLLEQTWYLRDSEVRDFALRVEPHDSPLPSPDYSDVVIGDAIDDPNGDVLSKWLGSQSTTARLKVLLTAQGSIRTVTRRTRGTATLILPVQAAQAAAVLNVMFDELVHDHPLHHVVALIRAQNLGRSATESDNNPALRQLKNWLRGPRLYADPEANEWLRPSNAIPQITAAAESAYAIGLESNLTKFVEKLARHADPDASEELRSKLSEFDIVSASLRTGLRSGIRFDQESTGLQPMAQILAGSHALNEKRRDLGASLRDMVAYPEFASALEASQDRKVDAQLLVAFPDGTFYEIGNDSALSEGTTVILSVHIGQRSASSLVVGDTPALDPLLPPMPDENPHVLEIVVFPKDFKLADRTPSVRRVRLPRYGGTEPVSWELTVPSRRQHMQRSDDLDQEVQKTSQGRGWIRGDSAELRFSVYFENQLLQSFALSATVVSDGPITKSTSVKITCDFSQTRRFGRLDDLGKRVLSMSLNDNQSGTHMLAVKGSANPPQAVEWNSGFIANTVDVLRGALFDSLATGPTAKFSFDPATLAVNAGPSHAFEDAVRQMARQGATIFTQLSTGGSRALVDLLNEVRYSEGKTIQVVLHQATYALPWSVLYDYRFPKTADWTQLPVCRGFDATGARCGCKAAPATGICLRGFWGFRHIVEQLGRAPEPLDDMPGRIAAKPTKPGLKFVKTVSNDSYLVTLSKALKGHVTLPSVEYDDAASLLDILRPAEARPSAGPINCQHASSS